MFTYSSDTTVIPSLTFTKAELVYAVGILLADLPASDNSTKIEMVEVRHYLNLIKEKVTLAAYDGTLKGLLCPSEEKDVQSAPIPSKEPENPSLPPMDELRKQFPTLSEDEIREIVEKAREERKKEEEVKEADTSQPIPPKPSFRAKPHIVMEVDVQKAKEVREGSMGKVRSTDKEDFSKASAKKFATLLGEF